MCLIDHNIDWFDQISFGKVLQKRQWLISFIRVGSLDSSVWRRNLSILLIFRSIEIDDDMALSLKILLNELKQAGFICLCYSF